MRTLHFAVIAGLIFCVFSSAHAIGLTVRFGGGLLYDDRASDGVLGGGQFALEMRLNKIPIGFQLASEYWTKGTLQHPYEIESYDAGKVLLFGYIGDIMPFLFAEPVATKTTYLYLGGGAGIISVPKIDDPDDRESGVAFDAVCGANVRIFWKLGLFVEGKYIYSSKTTDNIKVIDFSDLGFLLGISLNFDL
ncbi:MAG: hypothetical protein WBE28_01680 [bacterium]